LELPADAQPNQPLPLIVHLHGGPTAVWPYSLYYAYFGSVMLSSDGFAVLSPNYRGSIGYGDKFVTDLIGRENDVEVEDILKGVDAMVERGIADPSRLGVTAGATVDIWLIV
jgi:dipeptidyl aminopeptidase/acylaminoacyl peptidase